MSLFAQHNVVCKQFIVTMSDQLYYSHIMFSRDNDFKKRHSEFWSVPSQKFSSQVTRSTFLPINN